MLLLALTLLTPAFADDAPTPPPAEGTLTHAVWQSLAQRHDPGCESALAKGERDAVREALVTVAETADAPPWAAVRAAVCLTREFGADETTGPVLERWVTDTAFSGLGTAVLQQLDALPQEQAMALGTSALQRTDARFRDRAVRALEDSASPELRALPKSVRTAEQ